MEIRVPLGEKEDHRREFKSAEALKNPEIVARGVVAMLNSEGGEVWVGLREENERAVAVEPIANPEGEGRRLLDYLVDSIEPSPQSGEVRIDQTESEDGPVLRVLAKPLSARRPYAWVRRGGRHFVLRIGARVREMTREEIRYRFSFSASTEGQAFDDARKRLLVERDQLQEQGVELLWLGLEPAANLELDLQDRALRVLFEEPGLTGNSPTGFNFAVPYSRPPQLRLDRLVIEDEGEDRRIVEVRRNGGMSFRVPLDSLWRGEKGELWPISLLEYPISAFRIVAEVYRGKLPPEERVVTGMGLFGIGGWKLRPHSPRVWPSYSRRPKVFEEGRDLTFELELAAERVEEEPDRCGYRLAERIYEAFGYRREQIPEEFDQKTGRLILPA